MAKYGFTYLQNGYISTPRGRLRVECIFNSERIAREKGYDIYFSLNGGLGVFTKHIDLYHLKFAIIDKQSPYKCKQIAPLVYFIDTQASGKKILLNEDKLIEEYERDTQLAMNFRDWCVERKIAKVKQGMQISVNRNIDALNFCRAAPDLMTVEKQRLTIYSGVAYTIMDITPGGKIYLTDVSGQQNLTTNVTSLNKVGIQLTNLM